MTACPESRSEESSISCGLHTTTQAAIWTFGVSDSLSNPIRMGIKIVPKMPLNLFCGTLDMPNGVFGVLTDLEKVGRDDFTNGKAKFVYVPV